MCEVTLQHNCCRASVMQLAIFMGEKLRLNEYEGYAALVNQE